MQITTTNKQVYYILKRFYSTFRLRRSPGNPNPNILSSQIQDITIVYVYKRPCTYTNDIHHLKDHLVIKYKYKNNPEVISLNLPWDKYNDLLTETS